jgi:hypothetical protein
MIQGVSKMELICPSCKRKIATFLGCPHCGIEYLQAKRIRISTNIAIGIAEFFLAYLYAIDWLVE